MRDKVGRDILPVNGTTEMLDQRPDAPLVPGHLVSQAQINVLESLAEQAVVTCKTAGDLDLRSIDRVLAVLLQVHTRAVETRSIEENEQYQRMRAMTNIGAAGTLGGMVQQGSSFFGVKL